MKTEEEVEEPPIVANVGAEPSPEPRVSWEAAAQAVAEKNDNLGDQENVVKKEVVTPVTPQVKKFNLPPWAYVIFIGLSIFSYSMIPPEPVEETVTEVPVVVESVVEEESIIVPARTDLDPKDVVPTAIEPEEEMINPVAMEDNIVVPPRTDIAQISSLPIGVTEESSVSVSAKKNEDQMDESSLIISPEGNGEAGLEEVIVEEYKPPESPMAQAEADVALEPKTYPTPMILPEEEVLLPEQPFISVLRLVAWSDSLSEDARKILQDFEVEAELFPKASIVIKAYVSSDTASPENDKISLKRAEDIRDILVNDGFLAKRIKAIGMGVQNPVAVNSSKEGRDQNRRVELELLPKAYTE